jgi:ParB family chromosome partitioning protein
MPISVAVEIATLDDAGTQAALQQAYERKQLRGRKLIAVKRLIQQRQRQGRGLFAPLPVAAPSQTGSNDQRTLLPAG